MARRTRALVVVLAGLLLAPTGWSQRTAEQTRELADGLFGREVYDLAVKEYESILKKHPNYDKLDVVYYRLGEAYLNLGRPDDAQKAYATLLTKYPKSPYAGRSSLRRAEKLVQQKKYKEALPLLEEVLKQKPAPDMAAAGLFYVGLCQTALKQAKKAKASFKKVTTDHVRGPFASLAALEYARLLQEDLGKDGANKDEIDAELERVFRIALQQPASNEIGGEATFQLGNLLYRQKKFREAGDMYASLFRLWPDSPRVTEAKLPAAWCQFNSGASAEALNLLQTMKQKEIMQSPGEWLYLKANSQRKVGDFDGSLASYDRLTSSAPKSPFTPPARYESVLILYEQKKFKEVAERAAALIDTPELKENALWLMAEAQGKSEQGLKAAKTYARIAKDFPKSERAREASLASAQGFESAGSHAEAATAYTTFSKAYPKDELVPRALYSAGLAHLKNGKIPEATAAWEDLAKRFPKSDLADDGLYQGGVSLYRDGKKAEAVKVFDMLVKSVPNSPHAHNARFYRAVLLDEQKKIKEASTAWQSFVDANPPEELRRQGLHRLGLNLYRQKKFEPAADVLAKATDTAEAKNIAPGLLLWLGQTQLDRGKHASAIRVADELLSRQNLGDRETQTGWWVTGRAEDAMKRTDLAIDAFQKCIAVKLNTRQSTEAALRLGELLRDAGRGKEAREALTIAGASASALGQLREQARSYFLLGEVARSEKDWNNAARYHMSVAVLFDDKSLTPQSLYRSAEAFDHLGKAENRDRNLAELKERYPDHELAGKPLPGKSKEAP